MEARRQELLSEEGGYWSRRMAAEQAAAEQLAAAQQALIEVCPCTRSRATSHRCSSCGLQLPVRVQPYKMMLECPAGRMRRSAVSGQTALLYFAASHLSVPICRVPTWRTLQRARQIAVGRPSVPGRRQTGSPGGEAAPRLALSSPLDGKLLT